MTQVAEQKVKNNAEQNQRAQLNEWLVITHPVSGFVINNQIEIILCQNAEATSTHEVSREAWNTKGRIAYAFPRDIESHLKSFSLAVTEEMKLGILMGCTGENIENMGISKDTFKTHFSSNGSNKVSEILNKTCLSTGAC